MVCTALFFFFFQKKKRKKEEKWEKYGDKWKKLRLNFGIREIIAIFANGYGQLQQNCLLVNKQQKQRN